MGFEGSVGYLYNCYNKGDAEGAEIVSLNCNPSLDIISKCFGKDEVKVELLNEESDIVQGLKDTKLYRSNAWDLDGENIILDWEK